MGVWFRGTLLKLFLQRCSLLALQTASQLNSKKLLQDYTDLRWKIENKITSFFPEFSANTLKGSLPSLKRPYQPFELFTETRSFFFWPSELFILMTPATCSSLVCMCTQPYCSRSGFLSFPYEQSGCELQAKAVLQPGLHLGSCFPWPWGTGNGNEEENEGWEGDLQAWLELLVERHIIERRHHWEKSASLRGNIN